MATKMAPQAQGALQVIKQRMEKMKDENDILRDENEGCKKEIERWKGECSRVGVRFLQFCFSGCGVFAAG